MLVDYFIGYTVPIVPVIGNHDAGGYFRSPEEVAFYFRYFPRENGLGMPSR